jgi:NAD(P)-dependent dehydrogenase (short-subunit alcohol dehydrogenase family)
VVRQLFRFEGRVALVPGGARGIGQATTERLRRERERRLPTARRSAMEPNRCGRIVNVASIAGKEGSPMAAAYSASKETVIAMTKAIGKDVADAQILITCVAPR